MSVPQISKRTTPSIVKKNIDFKHRDRTTNDLKLARVLIINGRKCHFRDFKCLAEALRGSRPLPPPPPPPPPPPAPSPQPQPPSIPHRLPLIFRRHFPRRPNVHKPIFDPPVPKSQGNDNSKKVPIIYVYNSPDEAGMAAIRFINPTSIAENLEYGGWVCLRGNKYNYTLPQKGQATSVSIQEDHPFFCQLQRGIYHTHGAYKEGYDNESFSDTDKNSVTKMSAVKATMLKNAVAKIFARYGDIVNRLRYNYLGTPCSAILRYDGMTREVTILQPADPACLARNKN